MPRLDDIDVKKEHSHEFTGDLGWFQEATGGLSMGGSYLLAGDPGIGKTTLSLQLLTYLAIHGHRVLYISAEQSAGDLKKVFNDRVWQDFKSQDHIDVIKKNLFLTDSTEVQDLDVLDNFLKRQVVNRDGAYHGVEVVVVDSLQAMGLSSASSKKLDTLNDYLQDAKSFNVTTILIGHITKDGKIAGAKKLEHMVDAVIVVRRAMRFRPLFVPKNRFAQATIKPIILEMTDGGTLKKSPHSEVNVSKIFGFATSKLGGFVSDIQATVSIPEWGASAAQNIPALSRNETRQLLHILSTIPGIDISRLSFDIQVFLPGKANFHFALILPITLSIISSYLRLSVPESSLFIGEVDLSHNIRAPENEYLYELLKYLSLNPGHGLKRIYLSTEAHAKLEKVLRAEFQKNKEIAASLAKLEFIDVDSVSALLELVWPKLGWE